MSARLLFFAVSMLLFLPSCQETTVVKADGTLLVNGGVWTKAKGRAMVAKVTRPDGTKIEVKNVTEEPDGVAGPQAAFDTVGNGVIAKALSGERQNASNNETKTAITKDNNQTSLGHHKLDNAAIPLKGESEVNAINAGKK